MCERDVRSMLTDKMGLVGAEDDNFISIEETGSSHLKTRWRIRKDSRRGKPYILWIT